MWDITVTVWGFTSGYPLVNKHRPIFFMELIFQSLFGRVYVHFLEGTIWLFNTAMERSTIFKFGKPSISMGHPWQTVSQNQRAIVGFIKDI